MANFTPFLPLVEMLLFQSVWSLTIPVLNIAPLIFMRCANCGVSLGNERVASRKWPMSSAIVDKCPVCSQPMA
ncbi:hypothetical protein [Sphingomonas sp. LT1P40]|uniref:hypothetical protein n=1 Tax=Alteristakelama amylovorans TaxID=3096166 RepID=UPI002FC9D47F